MSKDDKMLEELKRIRELLEPEPAPPSPPPPKGIRAEFMDFLSKYKVMGLAVAFIMGLYLGALVQALVTDFIMPVIGLALSGAGMGNLATLKFGIPAIDHFDASGNPLNADGTAFKGQVFGVGPFLVALITFLIVAFVIFLIVKLTKRMGIE